jgi:elongation factor Ts
MSSDNILEKVKELREITGVGFKDCKNAIDETNGDIQKSIDLLRTKGIAKANKRMSRVAAEGIICIYEKDNEFSMVEINSETDFVAKNNEFISFAKEISALALNSSGNLEKVLNSKMLINKSVQDSLVDLISKIGEKITLRRVSFINKDKSVNFSYTHSPMEKNVGKLGVLLSLETTKSNDEVLSNFGKNLSMHIAACSPLAIDKENLDQKIIDKEKEIITEELKNSGKKPEIAEKIATGKLNKFINENTLLNQDWIMEPKKKVKDVLKEVSGNETINIKTFIRFKVGEGIEK